MGVTTTQTNKPFNPRGNDQSPLAFNRAKLYSGKALDFDGVNDNISFTELVMTAGNKYSFCIYANRDDNGTIWSRDNQWIEINFTSGAVQLRTYDTGWNTYTIIDNVPANEWHQIIVTYDVDANIWESYLNGQFIKSVTAAEPSQKKINRIGSSGGGFYNGEFSNAKIFNTALTAAQVADLYNNPEKVVPTGVDNTALKLFLPMQEGAGTTAYDGSGNGNHGTISGATYTHGIGAPVSQTAVIDWNKPYYFDGVDDSFTTGTYQALGDRTITLSFYSSDYSLTGIYPNTLFAFNTAGGGNTDIVRISADGYVAVYNGATQLGTPTIQVNENELTHIAIVTDAGTETKVYVNGELSYSYNAWSPSVGSTDIFNIGQETDGVNISDLWRGFIFNVGVFDSVLTQSEIQSIQGKRYADLTSAEKTNLVSFYSLQNDLNDLHGSKNLTSTGSTSALLIPQGLTSGRDLLGNLFENVRKQGALNLDGNSWAEVHDNASVDLTDGISLECWYYNDGSRDKGLFGRYFSGNTSFLLYAANTANSVEFFTNTSSSLKTNLSSGWHHLLGTYDGANRKLYVDGVLEDTDAYTTDMGTNSKPIEIGRYFGASAKAYTNQIAQPRIYNRALTAEEVARNYNNAKSIYTNS